MLEDWRTVKIRNEIVKQIERFLKTKQAKQEGYTSVGQFVNEAVKKTMDELDLKRFEHFNFHDDLIRVLDNSIGLRGDIIELRKKGHNLACGLCEQIDCVHIKFVWSDPDLVLELKRAGLKSPF